MATSASDRKKLDYLGLRRDFFFRLSAPKNSIQIPSESFTYASLSPPFENGATALLAPFLIS